MSEIDDGLDRVLALIDEESGWRPVVATGAGWYPIMVSMIDDLVEIDPDLVLRQIKQKFGELQVYVKPTTDAAVLAATGVRISAAEREAAVTCEECGEPGRLRTETSSYATLCDPHAATLLGLREDTDYYDEWTETELPLRPR